MILRRGRCAGVEALLENLAGFEREDLAPGDDDLIAGLRIAPFARPLGVDDKIAETGDFDLLAFFEAALDDLERGLDDVGRVLFREAHLLVDAGDDFSFGHVPISPSGSPARFTAFSLSAARRRPPRAALPARREAPEPPRPSASGPRPGTISNTRGSSCLRES